MIGLKHVDYTVRPFFIKIIAVSVLVYLCTAWFSTGYYHGDEHFQLIEFANYKLGHATANQLAWEFKDRIRPGLQPAMVYAFLKVCNAVGIDNSFNQVRILRFISMIFFLLVLYSLTLYTLKKITSLSIQKGYILLAFMLWFMPFLAVRFTSETWSMLFFIISFLIVEQASHKKNAWLYYLLAGFILGLSFQLRYQILFMIAGFFMWNIFIKKSALSFFLCVNIGFLVAIILGIFCDSWLYNEFVFTPWLYFKSNIILNKAVAMFGSSPWYYYFVAVFNQAVFPFGSLFIVSTLLFYIILPKQVLTWITLPFIVVHFFISHKELRFLFPLILFMPVMIGYLLQELKNKGYLQKYVSFLNFKRSIVLFCIVNSIPLLVVCTAPANNPVEVLNILNNKIKKLPATLYYIEQNPTSPFGLPFTFYQLPKQVQLIHIESPDSIKVLNTNEKIYLVINRKARTSNYSFDETKYNCLFSSIPLWAYNLNFNNWIGRTTVCQLYELK